MNNGEVTCGRCHQVIVDSVLPDGKGMTAGYYVTPWQGMGTAEEKYVCDNCMWQDPKYIAIYGRMTLNE
jgi:hypothetical protein